MNFSSVNWLAVIACVVVSMIVGSLWFNPKTFFPMWWRAIGRSDKQQPTMAGGSPAVTWGLTILASLVLAISMSFIVKALGSLMSGGTNFLSGALTGFMMWLGFVATTSLTNKIFANQLKAWVLEAGNHLVTLVLMGAILGAWH